VIAREKNPDLEVEAKNEKTQRNETKRKIKNETEVETEKKRMTKTNGSRYCSFVLKLHQAKINAKCFRHHFKYWLFFHYI